MTAGHYKTSEWLFNKYKAGEMINKIAILLVALGCVVVIATLYLDAKCYDKGGFPAANGVCLKKESLLK